MPDRESPPLVTQVKVRLDVGNAAIAVLNFAELVACKRSFNVYGHSRTKAGAASHRPSVATMGLLPFEARLGSPAQPLDNRERLVYLKHRSAVDADRKLSHFLV